MSFPPVTEEDKPAVESIIKRLSRLRKREHLHGSKDNKGKLYGQPNLNEAITELMEYGAMKGWWEFDRYNNQQG